MDRIFIYLFLYTAFVGKIKEHICNFVQWLANMIRRFLQGLVRGDSKDSAYITHLRVD